MSKLYTNYVLGFMFSNTKQYVALIRKTHPEWQKGKLNGIGGKLMPGEKAVRAMVREFAEEAGYLTEAGQWQHFARLMGKNDNGEGFVCDCFATVGPLECLDSMEEESIEMVFVPGIRVRAHDKIVDNTPALIAIALDHLHDGRPCFAYLDYTPRKMA